MSGDDTLRGMLALLAYLPAEASRGMVRMYRDAITQQLALIDPLIGAQPGAPELLAAVHKLAGSAGMMQDQALCAAARAMEAALRDGQAATAQAHWPQLQNRAALTQQVLQGLGS